MRVGVTGTREGTTEIQRRNARNWFKGKDIEELHHGGCRDADEFFAHTGACHARKVICHPPIIKDWQSDYAVQISDECREPAEYLERNQRIVVETDILLAMPKGPEERRSGTWATIRMARSIRRPILIFYPDGRVVAEGNVEDLQLAKGK